MIKINFGKLGIVFAIIFLLSQNIFVNANYQDFVNQLKIMNITVDDILQKNAISRYELTRLLNSVECKDCINTSQSMKNTYNSGFWNNFKKLPGRDFDDIDYLGGMFDNESYYYCVAYVGDKKYMRGYPKEISPICAGDFCGERNVTKAEFIEVLVNLLSKYIYQNYDASWNKIKIWKDNLEKNSQEYNYLDDSDRINIDKQAKLCLTSSCKITNPIIFKTYLKYCMYNLDECGMQGFGKVGEGHRPVAELNILYQQQIIDINEAKNDDITLAVNGTKVIDILYKVHNVVDCEFNNDYDCDGLDNTDDNCPNLYNPHQTNTDNDEFGDVCDDDIDNDGIKNPINIVDDFGRINISVATKNMDNCLFVKNKDQKIDSDNFIGDACSDLENKVAIYIQVNEINGSIPLKTEFTAITKGTVKNIVRDFGDGDKGIGKTVEHIYYEPGVYTIIATADGPNNQGIAKTTVIAGKNKDNDVGLIIHNNKIGTKKGDEILFSSLNVGDIDYINREIGDGTEIKKTAKQSFSKIFNKDGEYKITAKAFKNNKIVAVGISHIAIGDNNKSCSLISNKIIPNIDQKVDFKTSFYNFTSNDIDYVSWDFGDGKKIINKQYNISHTYSTEGIKSIVQTIKLKDKTSFVNIITIYVMNPESYKSYGITFKPDKLRIRRGEDIFFQILSNGDNLENYILASYEYMPGATKRIFGTDKFPINSEYFKYNFSKEYEPKGDIIVNACQTMEGSATIIVQGMDSCLEALLKGNLGQYHCDMDKDGVPDVCDDDIDGDGVKNLIGIITHENSDCNITDQNIDIFLLDKQLENICTLDNCPFTINKNQFDLNNNKVGDLCENTISELKKNSNNKVRDPINKIRINSDINTIDTDNDGIPDKADLCPKIPETYNNIDDIDGCPEIGTELNCESKTQCNDIICPGPCNSCPCQYTDYVNNLTFGDNVRATLRDFNKLGMYSISNIEKILDNTY